MLAIVANNATDAAAGRHRAHATLSGADERATDAEATTADDKRL